ncbi:hypothetical protein AA0113_g4028 [Alternaria arborescens]|uniref:Uncharacterized protein n=1 Tax=Alternaria arborescens TaxID=156630 RepID=A0A4V1X7D7_9PLEO|nr:hypothetical protein AA0113_g4028 [Alternaria arborescens]
MPYELRPEAKLKRPARYDESDDSDLSGSPEPRSESRDSVIDSQVSPPPNTLTATPGAPNPLTLPTGAPHLSQNPSPEKDKPEVPRATIPNTSDPRRPLKSRGMAHVKHVKKPSRENASPETKRARHFNKTAKRVATPLEDGPSPAFSAPRPAAFPSLTDNAPPSPPVAIELTKHGMRELAEAMDAEDYERVTFEELWPSIRQEIIERILDDFAQKNYPSPFYPVCRILDITKERLDAIMAENARVWTDDEIPPYFKEYRRRYPKAIIDPDEPPPQCVVEAIAFLKQNSLPGSLLGEWQTMPAVEVFNNPAPFYFPTKKEAFELLRRGSQDAQNQASRRQRDGKKLPPPQCRVCGQTGHTYWKFDKNGVHECPRRRQQVAQHNAELEILRAQASSEIKAFKERDFAMKNITPNCSLSESTPIDAAPYLEAWQANRANPNLHPHLQQPAALPEDGRAKYINQLQTDNLSHPGWVRNQLTNRRSTLTSQMSISHVASKRMNPPNLPPRPQTSNSSANPLIWPNSRCLTRRQGTRLHPQSATLQIPKKRGPYKKKEGKEGHNSTTPPNRVVGRDGMVFLSSLKRTQDEITSQKRREGADATVETGLVTPPLQQPHPSTPSSTSTCKAGETFTVQKNVGATKEVKMLRHSTIPPVPSVSETNAASAMESNGANATVLPRYPYQASSAQRLKGVPSLKEMARAVMDQRQVNRGKEKVPRMDTAP